MNLDFIKNNEVRDSVEAIIVYLKHPVEQIKYLPDWSWRRVLLALVVLSAISGFIKNMIVGNTLVAILSIFSNPILSLLMILTSCVFFYYSLQIFLKKTVDFRKLFVMLFFANLPLMFFQILSEVLSPVTLVGLSFSCFITIVGITENFSVDKKWALKLVGSAYALLFFVWVAGQIKSLGLEENFEPRAHRAPRVELNQ
jgi:hypothetical protein